MAAHCQLPQHAAVCAVSIEQNLAAVGGTVELRLLHTSRGAASRDVVTSLWSVIPAAADGIAASQKLVRVVPIS
jgi:hypothetical protein